MQINKLMKVLLPPVLFFLLYISGRPPAKAQQLPWFTQYRAYTNLINPAALSPEFLEDKGYYDLVFNISYRTEGSSNFEGVPRTMVFQADWTPKPKNYDRSFRFFLGGYFMKDQFDLTHFSGAFLRFGVYTLHTPKLGSLSVGFNLGMNQFRIKTADSDYFLPSAIAPNNPDPYLNLGFGVFYSRQIDARHDLYAGFSIPQLKSLDLTEENIDGRFSPRLDPDQYYVLLGANIYLADYAFLEPSLWLKSVYGNQFHIDFNLRYKFRQPFWLGAGVSSQSTVHAEMGVHVGDMQKKDGRRLKTRRPFLKIGLGYDYSFSELPTYLHQSAELNVSMVIPSRQNK